MVRESDDPGVVRAVAVDAGDVATAYEYGQRSDERAVLRVTPPFHGRMRARLHVRQPGETVAGDGSDGGPVYLPPERLVDEAAVPPYPDPDETADRLRADDDAAYSVESHRERHVEAVRRWREAVEGAVVDETDLPTPDGPKRVSVSVLG